MCIVLVSTTHPDYALIIIDNRDEFILRPTSRPHWWTHPNGSTSVLSSRDLQRGERGTWMGLTRDGYLAVLTNYREIDTAGVSHPIHGARSRGAITTHWLGGHPTKSTREQVHDMVVDTASRATGGFSMLCGRLRLRQGADGVHGIEPLAIITNRDNHVDHVPWIASARGEIHGLSNAQYDNSRPWAKVAGGSRLLRQAIEAAVAADLREDELVDALFAVLDNDTLPRLPGVSLHDYIQELKNSIFVPLLGDAAHRDALAEARARGPAPAVVDDYPAVPLMDPGAAADPNYAGFETGMYGTQRQTVVLVDWEGRVTYCERALWDGNGNPIAKGEGDVVFRFKIEDWESAA